MSRVSSAQLCGFAPGPTHQGCSVGESLVACVRFNRLGIWTPNLPHQKQTFLFIFAQTMFAEQLAKHNKNQIRYSYNAKCVSDKFSKGKPPSLKKSIMI